jgi:hypothetical protein
VQLLAAQDDVDDLFRVPDAASDLARSEAATIRESLAALTDRLDAGDIDEDEWLVMSRAKKARLAEVEAQVIPSTAPVMDGLAESADPAEWFAGLKLEQQRALVDRLLTVKVLKGLAGGRGFRPEAISVTPRKPVAA